MVRDKPSQEIQSNSDSIKRRSVLKTAGAAGTVGIAGLAGCLGSVTNGGDDTVRIGFVEPMSGPISTLGEAAKNTNEITIEQIGENDGFGGRTIETFLKDTQGVPDTGIKRARELVDQENVDFIIGNSTSAVGMAISSFVQEQTDDVVYLATGPQTPLLTKEECKKTTFRCTSNTIQFNTVGAYLTHDRAPDDATRVAGVNPDYVYGHNAWRDFKAALKERRPDVEFVSETFPAFQKGEYKNEIQKTLDAEPDIIHSVLFSGDMVSFVKQGHQFDLFDKIDTFYAGQTPSVVAETLGKEFPEGALLTPTGNYEWPESIGTPERVTRFSEEYFNRFDTLPGLKDWDQNCALYGVDKAVTETDSLDRDTLISQLEGQTWESAAPSTTFRPEDHAAVRDFMPAGEMRWLPEYEMMNLTNMRVYPSDTWMDPAECNNF